MHFGVFRVFSGSAISHLPLLHFSPAISLNLLNLLNPLTPLLHFYMAILPSHSLSASLRLCVKTSPKSNPPPKSNNQTIKKLKYPLDALAKNMVSYSHFREKVALWAGVKVHLKAGKSPPFFA